jgi:hypothetical protein
LRQEGMRKTSIFSPRWICCRTWSQTFWTLNDPISNSFNKISFKISNQLDWIDVVKNSLSTQFCFEVLYSSLVRILLKEDITKWIFSNSLERYMLVVWNSTGLGRWITARCCCFPIFPQNGYEIFLFWRSLGLGDSIWHVLQSWEAEDFLVAQ